MGNAYNQLMVEFNVQNVSDPSGRWIESWTKKAQDLIESGELSESQKKVLSFRLKALGVPVK